MSAAVATFQQQQQPPRSSRSTASQRGMLLTRWLPRRRPYRPSSRATPPQRARPTRRGSPTALRLRDATNSVAATLWTVNPSVRGAAHRLRTARGAAASSPIGSSAASSPRRVGTNRHSTYDGVLAAMAWASGGDLRPSAQAPRRVTLTGSWFTVGPTPRARGPLLLLQARGRGGGL